LTGFFSNPSSVFPEAREFWKRVAIAVKEIHEPSPVDLDDLARKLKDRNKEFNGLLNGPLAHPLVPFRLTRLMNALMAVVLCSDEAWEALLEHCRQLEERQRQQAEAEV